MSDHEARGHHRDHETRRQGDSSDTWWKRAHKDWRVWAAVALMVVAMIVYVMTMDEALQPGGPVQQPIPAAP
jgi:hypothetical protein